MLAEKTSKMTDQCIKLAWMDTSQFHIVRCSELSSNTRLRKESPLTFDYNQKQTVFSCPKAYIATSLTFLIECESDS